jgi:hypothetical protein
MAQLLGEVTPVWVEAADNKGAVGASSKITITYNPEIETAPKKSVSNNLQGEDFSASGYYLYILSKWP